VSTTPEVPEVIEGTETPKDPDAVVIVKITDDRGNVSTAVQTLGDLQATEVQTIIEIGLKGWRDQLGLNTR
jgi:hypothetical protein